jgi:hypothetical protein
MAYFHKKLERRTYSQDRYYILIKRQKSGKATFNELTELDEIVNRVPDIREKVIMESFFMDDTEDLNEPTNNPEHNDNRYTQHQQHRNLWNRIASFITRAFTTQMLAVKAGNPLKLRLI